MQEAILWRVSESHEVGRERGASHNTSSPKEETHGSKVGPDHLRSEYSRFAACWRQNDAGNGPPGRNGAGRNGGRPAPRLPRPVITCAWERGCKLGRRARKGREGCRTPRCVGARRTHMPRFRQGKPFPAKYPALGGAMAGGWGLIT